MTSNITYEFLFTNDLRTKKLIPTLEKISKLIDTDTVPSGQENKSLNNVANTYKFYFNLYTGSNCLKSALSHDFKQLTVNFIKKFQYPNTRNKNNYFHNLNSNQYIAPYRTILKILFLLKIMHGKDHAFLTIDEVVSNIFKNKSIVDKSIAYDENLYNQNLISTVNLIYKNRASGYVYQVAYVSDEKRQFQELMNVLIAMEWCIFSNNKYQLNLENMSPEDKREFYDLLSYMNFWDYQSDSFENVKKSYIQYMDIQASKQSQILNNQLHCGKNILYYGVPGVGKSYTIENEHCSDPKYIERVVFHPDYTYSDFVGQILPRIYNVNGTEHLKYVFTPGPFARILKKAFDDSLSMYYLIIEEINRGNAPAIFGEIFQLLDRDVNGQSIYSISNYELAKIVYANENQMVRIPSNLTILATMNTADQNVFVLDTAFQRRWKMRHIQNDFDNLKNKAHSDLMIEGSQISWGAFAKEINRLVLQKDDVFSSTEDKRLGVYFVKDADELSYVSFSEKVLKYLWDDVFKTEKDSVFKDQFTSFEDVLQTYKSVASSEDNLKLILNPNVYQSMIDAMPINGQQLSSTISS